MSFQKNEENLALVQKILLLVPVKYISKTIESTDNRLSKVMVKRGKRIKCSNNY